MIDVIYLSGGQGVRSELGFPKQFSRINGKPILIYGLETLNKIPEEIRTIIIPCTNQAETYKYMNDYNIKKYKLCEYGETRQQSVYKALKFVKTEFVLIMEAVRPFVSIELIKKVLETESDFVVPRNIMYSTVITDYGTIMNRNDCGEVQMPQKYKTKLLRNCHEYANCNKITYTDDSALVIANSFCIPWVIVGEQCNIKITTPLDLKLAEGIYEYYNNRE